MKKESCKRILCIHDASALGHSSLSAILPVLAVSGLEPVALPTAVFSSHTGGLTPARVEMGNYGMEALAQYKALGLSFDYLYSGYLASPAGAELAERAHALWPAAPWILDPVMADNGALYKGMEGMAAPLRRLCAKADLILPNLTEAALLMGAAPVFPATPDEALALAERVRAATGAGGCVITGIAIGSKLACAGAGPEPCYVAKPHLSRSFPGTGDLFGAVLVSRLAHGNALCAAVDVAAEFVAAAILATPDDSDPRMGVSFEPLLARLAPAL